MIENTRFNDLSKRGMDIFKASKQKLCSDYIVTASNHSGSAIKIFLDTKFSFFLPLLLNSFKGKGCGGS